jgi:transposase
VGFLLYDRAERDARIEALRAEGQSIAEIARAVGCSASAVHEVLNADKHEAYARRRRNEPGAGSPR